MYYGEKAFEVAVDGVERFNNGDVTVKKEILESIGQNPVLMDGELRIDTFPWLVMMENEYPKLEAEYNLVRTLPDKIRDTALDSVCSSWLGRRFVKITFSQQDDDPIIDVEEIRNLIDENIEEADHE